MYEKFLLNNNLMKILLWFIKHDGEYSASLLQEELGLDSFIIVKYLHLLYTLGVCEVTPEEEIGELFIQKNADSEIIKCIEKMKNFLDEKMNETDEIEIVLDDDKEDLKNLLNENSSLDIDELLAQCQESADESIEITKEDVAKFLIILTNCFMI